MVSAVILAGGKGKRMESNVSKQYIEIKEKPILYYTLKKFIDCEAIDNITLVLPEEEIEYCINEVLKKYSLKVDNIVAGGKERQDSVYNGLKSISNTDIVLIHDGARPFVSNRIIEDGIKFAKEYGAAAPGVTPKDTIKVKSKEGFSLETPDRESLVSIQTPQTFNFEIILNCHKKIKKHAIVVTDDTMVAELYGNKVYLYNGDYTNIKVTTPEDLILAERLV
ncbi:MAG: 2-C-methyl-D-erythritol 4-phosphate cytidylyltransferase [Clostridium sp.]